MRPEGKLDAYGAIDARQACSVGEKRRIIAEARKPGASVSLVARKHRVSAGSLAQWLSDPRLAPEKPRAGEAANNRLPSNIRGARNSQQARWRAFDQLPECVADAIRSSRSKLCPVAVLQLVNQGGHSPQKIAQFLQRHAAWTDWCVLAEDFGKKRATLLRPDAPRRKPKLRRARGK